MKQSNKVKTPIVFKIGLVLVCALLVTTSMMGGLYARYTTSASGEDSARVARFEFTDNLDPQKQIIPASFSPGEELITSVEIKNSSEVALQCVVEIVNLTDNLPIESKTIKSTVISCNDTINFSWNIEWPKGMNSVEYMGKMDVLQLVVTVEQVD